MANHTFTIKRNDTSPSIKESLTLGGAPINLTGATVRFRMTPLSGGTPKVDAVASIDSPATAGIVHYAWLAQDTDTSGDYLREWQITLADNSVLTVPNDINGYLVTITDDLA